MCKIALKAKAELYVTVAKTLEHGALYCNQKSKYQQNAVVLLISIVTFSRKRKLKRNQN